MGEWAKLTPGRPVPSLPADCGAWEGVEQLMVSVEELALGLRGCSFSGQGHGKAHPESKGLFLCPPPPHLLKAM